MTVEIVVGLSNLGPEGRPQDDDLAFDPLMEREAAEALIAELREEGITAGALTGGPPGRATSFRSALARTNVQLAALGLPTHAEPADPEPWEPSVPSTLPFEALRGLRRVMAHHLVWPGRPVQPLPAEADPREDPVMAEAADRHDNHLIHHAETEGFYLPVSFSQVIRDPSGTSIPGGWLGSTHRLAEELREIAPLLDLEPVANDDRVPEDTVARIRSDRFEAAPFHLERWAWLLHVEAASRSLADRLAIVYR